jgi:lysophospholipase L1-like esterase
VNRLAVFGNSVSLPPREDPAVRPYATLLGERLAPDWQVLLRAVDGGRVQDVAREAKRCLETERPDACVIQVGIVDCAPRPLSERERTWLGRVPVAALQRKLIRLLHVHRARVIAARRLIQWTPLPEFRAAFQDLADACCAAGQPLAVLEILPGTRAVVARNPKLAAQIDAYNAAMRAAAPVARFLDAEEQLGGAPVDELAVGPESVHLNQQGHQRIARALEGWLLS